MKKIWLLAFGFLICFLGMAQQYNKHTSSKSGTKALDSINAKTQLALQLTEEPTSRFEPIIKEFGSVSTVANADFSLEPERELRAVFDIDYSNEDTTKLNVSINTPARFLNMHAQNGVAAKNMKVALVVHGAAFKDVLNDTAYAERYKTPNPNRALIEALLAADAQIILCGQTANYRNVAKSDLLPGVQLALSAMTALVRLQQDDYQLIKF